MREIKDFLNDPKTIYTFAETCVVCGSNLIAFKDPDTGLPRSQGVCPNCGQVDGNEKTHADKSLDIQKDALRKKAVNRFMNTSVYQTFSVFTPKFADYVTTNQGTKQAYDKAKQVSSNIKAGTVLHSTFTGVTGAGKSHLAMAILWDVLESSGYRHSVSFVSFPALLSKYKRSLNDKNAMNDFNRLIKEINKSFLVVVDDLGAEGKKSDYIIDIVRDIFEGRVDKNTIITTNLTGKELRANYTDALVSRMMSHSAGHHIVFNNMHDYRLNGTKSK